MKHIGYIRVSTDKQDLSQQKHLLLEYAQKNRIVIDEFIEIEVSSGKSKQERRIVELMGKLEKGDILVVAELSRLSRNMRGALNLIHDISEKGVKIVFIRQPELSTNAPHTKLLFAIYAYFSESEKDFISMRTKTGLAKARADGKNIGRIKGSRNKKTLKKLSPYKNEICKHLELRLPLTSIHKIINGKLKEQGKSVSYHSLRYFVLKDTELSKIFNKINT